jgi:hypothetical protein
MRRCVITHRRRQRNNHKLERRDTIEVARLGGWNKLVRMLVAHDPVAAWPRGSVAHEPGRWGLTMLGEVSYRVNLPLVVR